MQRPYDALHDAKYDALQEALKLQFDRTVAELVCVDGCSNAFKYGQGCPQFRVRYDPTRQILQMDIVNKQRPSNPLHRY